MSDTASKIEISDSGPSSKTISIEIGADTVAEKLAESLEALVTEAALPGFRKGRAPKRLVEKRFGTNIRDEAKNQLVSAAYSEAVEEHKLRVVGEPVAEDLVDVQIEDGKPLSFQVEVEVVPEFDMPNLDGLEVMKPAVEVTDDMVSAEVEKICINDGELEERDASEPGDYLTGHGVMTGDDGTEHYNIDGCVVQIPAKDGGGKGMILGIIVDDLAKQLGTPKAGDDVTIKTTGPDNHEVDAVRGAKLTITFKVQRIDRIIPADIQTVLSSYGFESEDAVRETVRTRLEQRAMVEQQSAMRQQVARHLHESVSFALPERLTETQTARTLERRRLELMYRGVDATEIEEHLAELRAASAEAAQRELKLFFILSKYADDQNIRVEEAEINGAIARMAMQRGVRPERLRQEMIQTNRIGTLYVQIREHKALDALVDQAAIKEVSAEEFNDAMTSLEGGESPSGGAAATKKTAKKTAKKASKKAATKSESKKSDGEG